VKYAVIADIHANLPALQAVMKDVAIQRCDTVVCLGDLVGYYAEPKECVDLIRGMNIPCVKGNHDEYCSVPATPDGFSSKAAEGVQWTRKHLTEDDRQWLASLPLIEVVDGFTIVHASLNQPHRWEYVFDKLAAASSFASQKSAVCFYGHTHVPVAFVRDGSVRGGTFTKFKVESGRQYFINPGSVGQPRDGCAKASYVVYDTSDLTVQLRRVAFERPDSGGDSAIPTGPNPKPKLTGSAGATLAEQLE
jgi:predicted phosphodiesterase